MRLTAEECYIFVDHSNLWIAGQKALAKDLIDTDRGSRYRVDLGKFLQLTTKGRHSCTVQSLLQMTPIWKAARKQNFVVKTFQRSGSGREKEVDVAMTKDIKKNLLQLQFAQLSSNITFIIVTGDRDLKPPIEEILEGMVPVELWSWDDSMALEFRRLANTNDLFTANKLDEVQKEFSYTAIMSTRQKRDIDSAHAIIYKDVPRGKRFIYALAGHVARLMRVFYITSHDFVKEDKQHLIFQFPHSKPEHVLKQLSKYNMEYQPCSYPEYISSLEHNSRPIQRLNSTYEAVDVDELDIDSLQESSMNMDIEGTDSNGSTTETEWETVARKKPGRMTYTRRRKDIPCEWGDHCAKARDCPYKHTEDEKRLFANFPKAHFKLLKTTICPYIDNHISKEKQMLCIYAHSEEDSWCRRCKIYGHLTDNCKG